MTTLDEIDDPEEVPFEGVDAWYDVHREVNEDECCILYLESQHADADEAARRVNYLNGGEGKPYPQAVDEPIAPTMFWRPYSELPAPEDIPDGQAFILFGGTCSSILCRYNAGGEHFVEIGTGVSYRLRAAHWWMMLNDIPEDIE
ncbi:hypothetical protein AGMMS49992_24180 [Clostridia bacterium]|nr:hypothetical protein AGMMS49992_24180 [Clostridia bacterium]